MSKRPWINRRIGGPPETGSGYRADISGIRLASAAYNSTTQAQEHALDIYVVKQGDSVDSIAKSAISAETILWDNQIEGIYRLAVGQALFIFLTSGGGGRTAYHGYGVPVHQ